MIERFAMAMRPNYQQQRGDRERAKQLKKSEKLKKREEDAARRKAGRDGLAPPDLDGDALGEPPVDER
jgi:hypothetical protein